MNSDGTCNWCDKQIGECTCGTNSIKNEPIEYSNSEPKVTKGDVIVDKSTRDELYVVDIGNDNEIIARYIDLRSDGQPFVWEKPYCKLSSAVPIPVIPINKETVEEMFNKLFLDTKKYKEEFIKKCEWKKDDKIYHTWKVNTGRGTMYTNDAGIELMNEAIKNEIDVWLKKNKRLKK